MLWVATEGPPFVLRDGTTKADPMRTITGAPQPFTVLTEEDLKRHGPVVVVLKTPADAREFEKRMKARAPAGSGLRVKVGGQNAALMARRSRLPPEPIEKLAREFLEEDEDLTWQEATTKAFEAYRASLTRDREIRQETKKKAPAAPVPAPKGGRRKAAEPSSPPPDLDEEDDEDDSADEEETSSAKS